MTMTNESEVLHYYPQQKIQDNTIYSTANTPSLVMATKCKNQSNSYAGLTYYFQNNTRVFNSAHDDDDDEVKRPMNSFLLWAKIMRKKYASENPNMHNAEISKLLGKIWNSMTTKDKRPFVEQAEKLRVLHMRTYPNYRYAPKRRKERRSHRMISPEVAAALHSTLFDVNNIITEQLSQNQILRQDLKSYGYLRNAFQQKNSSASNDNKLNICKDKFPSNLQDITSDSPASCSTLSPSSCPENSSVFDSPQLACEHHGETETDPVSVKTTESMTLHYYPAEISTNSQLNLSVETMEDIYPKLSDDDAPQSRHIEDDETSEEDETQNSIDEEFSYYLNRHTSLNSHDQTGGYQLDNDSFWNDIGDIITSASI